MIDGVNRIGGPSPWARLLAASALALQLIMLIRGPDR
jgi:hypothetical protein